MNPPYYFITANGKTRVYEKYVKYEGKEGIIPLEQINDAVDGESLKTHLGKNISIHSASPLDIIEDFRRGPQTIVLKDAMYIIGRLGINKNSIVLEGGTGSGSMASYFALYSSKVYSFERRKEFYDISAKNIGRIKSYDAFSDIIMIEDDISSAPAHVKEKVDAIFLDVPEPWKYLDVLKPLLNDNGRIACYVPNVTQAIEFANSLKGFVYEECSEVMVRQWNVHGRIAKPHKELMHTAFLLFALNKRA